MKTQDKKGSRRRTTNFKSGASRPRADRPRASRASEEAQKQFQERKAFGTNQSGDAREKKWTGKAKEQPADNVSLYLSARMLELAEELALETKMPLRVFLTEALKYVLLAKGERLGKRDKYVTEFVSQNKLKTSTWPPKKTET